MRFSGLPVWWYPTGPRDCPRTPRRRRRGLVLHLLAFSPPTSHAFNFSLVESMRNAVMHTHSEATSLISAASLDWRLCLFSLFSMCPCASRSLAGAEMPEQRQLVAPIPFLPPRLSFLLHPFAWRVLVVAAFFFWLFLLCLCLWLALPRNKTSLALHVWEMLLRSLLRWPNGPAPAEFMASLWNDSLSTYTNCDIAQAGIVIDTRSQIAVVMLSNRGRKGIE